MMYHPIVGRIIAIVLQSVTIARSAAYLLGKSNNKLSVEGMGHVYLFSWS
jgi:hypothetical protein